MNDDGGFKGRGGHSDLYYTVFGLESLLALRADIPRLRILSYLESFSAAMPCDLVHLASLIRCQADLGDDSVDRGQLDRFVESIEKHRCADGGYSHLAGGAGGSAYGCFLALAAYQDMCLNIPNQDRVVACVKSLQTDEQAYANDASVAVASTPATAAALTTLHYLCESIEDGAIDWLSRQVDPAGGFYAVPGSPMPDLLSTATALHALATIGRPITDIADRCLNFLDALFSDEGGFCGNMVDDTLDCEYTYYGLLGLGHLCK